MATKTEGGAFSNDEHRLRALQSELSAKLNGKPYAVVWICKNELPRSPSFCFPPRSSFTRLFLVFEGRPVSLGALNSWREWAQSKGAMELKVDFVDGEVSDDSMRRLLRVHCEPWMRGLPEREPSFVRCGEWVEMPKVRGRKDDPALLTMMFGSMGELLTRMDLIRNRFRQACEIADADRLKYLAGVTDLLSRRNHGDAGELPTLKTTGVIDCLPRSLLTGETGVGKTLFVRYLAGAAKVTRIAIPEYLGKEDMFEYDLFGYAAGAYTGGREEGSLGLLLESVGDVVFLDELGEANDIIQAKLLAYLDDYAVRPRGWTGKPFFCPTLVVGATNRNIGKMKGFRKDLLARFTDVAHVPPLRERGESFPFILDCLLQQNAINPGCKVQEIGEQAFDVLKRYQFPGNFRELETLLRTVCEIVAKDGRNYISRRDLAL
jgi:Sigma-54 interaction domain